MHHGPSYLFPCHDSTDGFGLGFYRGRNPDCFTRLWVSMLLSECVAKEVSLIEQIRGSAGSEGPLGYLQLSTLIAEEWVWVSCKRFQHEVSLQSVPVLSL